MPVVIVNALKTDNLETKRVLVKEITDAVVKAYKAPRQMCVVVLKEDELENVGIGGTLLVDHKPA